MRKIIAFIWDLLCLIPLLLLSIFEYPLKGIAVATKKLNIVSKFMMFANKIHFKIDK